MPFQFKSPFWQKARVWIRRCRITLLLTLLALLGIFIFLNQFGLPGFVRKPILDGLRSRGIDLEFARLRLRWYRGIVADNVRFGQAQPDAATSFKAKAAELKLSVAQLLHGKLVVRAVAIRDWEILKQRQAPQAGTLSGRLQRFSDELEKISFSAPPEFRLRVAGDASDLPTF